VAEYVPRLRDIVGGEELLRVPAVSIALRDAEGRVLLARHSEGGVWLLPGGAIEPTETPADATVREMFEETGVVVRLTGLVGIFGGPEFVVHYRNGHRTLCRRFPLRDR
jgi:8-oxo-dGTP pyrophosphatase MutT (NUDIX family)